ncbi:MAG: DUF1456 family protein [Cellulosilyticaceae bacterium]
MDNNDLLIRLRYALDIKDAQMVEVFKLGGMELTEEQVRKLLIKSVDIEGFRLDSQVEKNMPCDNRTLELFLNGLIIFKRGQQEPKPGQTETPLLSTPNSKNMNNILLKKLKIALELTSEDVLAILAQAGIVITKGELSAVLRKEGHKNYKVCGDRYARNFLKGLALKNRG